MSTYHIFTLVFPDVDTVPADPTRSWPGPIGEPWSSGYRPGVIRHHAVDDTVVGIFVHKVRDKTTFAAAIFEHYAVGAVVFTSCNDTSDTCFGELYIDESDGIEDEYGEWDRDRQESDTSERYGRGLQAYAEDEWGFRPWTIWDMWDGRGEHPIGD